MAKSTWRGIHCNHVGLIYLVPGLGRRLLLQPTPQRREEPKPQGLARAELSAVHGGAIYRAIQPSRSGMCMNAMEGCQQNRVDCAPT